MQWCLATLTPPGLWPSSTSSRGAVTVTRAPTVTATAATTPTMRAKTHGKIFVCAVVVSLCQIPCCLVCDVRCFILTRHSALEFKGGGAGGGCSGRSSHGSSLGVEKSHAHAHARTAIESIPPQTDLDPNRPEPHKDSVPVPSLVPCPKPKPAGRALALRGARGVWRARLLLKTYNVRVHENREQLALIMALIAYHGAYTYTPLTHHPPLFFKKSKTKTTH